MWPPIKKRCRGKLPKSRDLGVDRCSGEGSPSEDPRGGDPEGIQSRSPEEDSGPLPVENPRGTLEEALLYCCCELAASTCVCLVWLPEELLEVD